jgi:hypothetical protein
MTEKLRRAVSIRQPYVELILRGRKREEYRSRPTNIRERVYLYASLKPGDYKWAAARYRVVCNPETLPTGHIVGSVEIIGCRKDRGDGYAWRLAKPRRYRVQLVPCNQPQPGFWMPKFLTRT